MICLFEAAAPTLAVMMYEIFIRKNRNNPLLYLGIFLCLSICFCLLNHIYPNSLSASQHEEIECKLTQQQRDHYWKLIHEHYYSAWSCSYDAESCCTNIKNAALRAAAKASTSAITVGIVSRNITATAIATATAALQELLEQLGWVWEDISSNLHCAQYNVEMAEFYQDILFNDGA